MYLSLQCFIYFLQCVFILAVRYCIQSVVQVVGFFEVFFCSAYSYFKALLYFRRVLNLQCFFKVALRYCFLKHVQCECVSALFIFFSFF